jgi:hypothetical protein
MKIVDRYMDLNRHTTAYSSSPFPFETSRVPKIHMVTKVSEVSPEPPPTALHPEATTPHPACLPDDWLPEW